MANANLLGKWDSYKSENLEAVFTAMGLNWMAKKLGSSINVTVTIEATNIDSATEGEIRLSVKSTFFNTETRLGIDRSVKWDGGTSTMMDCYTCWEDGKLIVYMGDVGTDPKLAGRRQIRELLDNDEMLLTIDWNGTTARRWFRRVVAA